MAPLIILLLIFGLLFLLDRFVLGGRIGVSLAGRIAMQEALAAASPHLLEPVHKLTVVCPSNAATDVAARLISPIASPSTSSGTESTLRSPSSRSCR